MVANLICHQPYLVFDGVKTFDGCQLDDCKLDDCQLDNCQFDNHQFDDRQFDDHQFDDHQLDGLPHFDATGSWQCQTPKCI